MLSSSSESIASSRLDYGLLMRFLTRVLVDEAMIRDVIYEEYVTAADSF